MNEGELSGRLGLRRLAGGRRGGDHRPRLPARRPRRLAAARLPRVDRRLGRDRPLGQAQGLERHRRGLPAPPAADRRARRDVRPDLQGQPAAALGRRRRGAAGRAGRRHHRHRRHRPRAAPARGQGLRVGGRRVRDARPRDRAVDRAGRRWSTPACSTGPASPSGCPTRRRGSAGSPTTAGRSRRGRPPTSCSTTRPRAASIEASESASLSRNTPYAGMELPGRVVATFLRGKADRARREAAVSEPRPSSSPAPPPGSGWTRRCQIAADGAPAGARRPQPGQARPGRGGGACRRGGRRRHRGRPTTSRSTASAPRPRRSGAVPAHRRTRRQRRHRLRVAHADRRRLRGDVPGQPPGRVPARPRSSRTCWWRARPRGS